MKKSLFFLLGFALLFVSCQNDKNSEQPNIGGDTEFVIQASIAEAYTTRSDSFKGGLDNVDASTHMLRLSYELRLADEVVSKGVEVAEITTGKFDITTRVTKGREYTFVAWADFVLKVTTAEEAVALHYDAADLAAVKVIATSLAKFNDDTKDAYAASHKFTVTAAGQAAEVITLKRAVAKIRYIATNYDEGMENGTYALEGLQVKYQLGQQLYTEYNILTNAIATPTAVADVFTPIDFMATDDSGAVGEKTLFWDYVIAPVDQAANHKIGFLFKGVIKNATETHDFNHSVISDQIVVAKNHLTTIKEDAFDINAGISVIIDGDFEGEIGVISFDGKTYATVQEAIDAAFATPTGSPVVLRSLNNATIGDAFTIPAGVTVTGVDATGTYAGSTAKTKLSGRIDIAGGTLKDFVHDYQAIDNRGWGAAAIKMSVAGSKIDGVDLITKGDFETKSEAILVSVAGDSNITITNCTFTNFWKAINFASTQNLVITNNTFNECNSFAGSITNSEGFLVEGNTHYRTTGYPNTRTPHLVWTGAGTFIAGTNFSDWPEELLNIVRMIKTSTTWFEGVIPENADRVSSVRVNDVYVNGIGEDVAGWTAKDKSDWGTVEL